MEKLKQMKEALVGHLQSEIYNIKEANTQELGAAVDMVKDLAEAIYYCTITEAMEEKEHEKKYYYDHYPIVYADDRRNYVEPMIYDYGRDIDKEKGRMYYTNGGNGSRSMYTEREYPYPLEFRDRREGRSPMSRKMYMEAKEMHHGKEVQMRELENYMQELTSDIAEMIKGASPEEKQLLQKKISTLATKVDQVNV